MITRYLKDNLLEKLNKGKAIVLIGPRQVGKTTLVNALLKDIPFLFLDGDDFNPQWGMWVSIILEMNMKF